MLCRWGRWRWRYGGRRCWAQWWGKWRSTVQCIVDVQHAAFSGGKQRLLHGKGRQDLRWGGRDWGTCYKKGNLLWSFGKYFWGWWELWGTTCKGNRLHSSFRLTVWGPFDLRSGIWYAYECLRVVSTRSSLYFEFEASDSQKGMERKLSGSELGVGPVSNKQHVMSLPTSEPEPMADVEDKDAIVEEVDGRFVELSSTTKKVPMCWNWLWN